MTVLVLFQSGIVFFEQQFAYLKSKLVCLGVVDMEKETELTSSRKSNGENGAVQPKPLQPLPLGKVGLFKLPQPDTDDDDDDGNDCISLKEWAPPEVNSPTLDPSGLSYSAWQPVKEKDPPSNGAPHGATVVKGNARSRPIGYTPLVESNGDVHLPPSIHNPEETNEEQDDQQEDDGDDVAYEDAAEDDQEDDEDEVEAELIKLATEPEDTEHRKKASHHHNISLVNGIAPPPTHPTGGIAFDISLDDHDDSRSRRSTGSSRGSSLRVSFINDVVLDSPSPPRHNNKSPFRARPNHSKSPSKSRPTWDSSAKIGKPAPPMPKKFVRPTLHGIKVKKGEGGVAKTAMRASTSALENGSAGTEGRSREPRDPKEAVARSWDSQHYRSGGEYDSVSLLISRSLVSSTEDHKDAKDTKKGDSNGVSSKPTRPFLPRSNGTRKPDDRSTHNGNGAEVIPDSLGAVFVLFVNPTVLNGFFLSE